MKKFYGVNTKFYDNGKVDVHTFVVEADQKPESTCEEKARYDEYFDYFATKKEAEQYAEDARNA